MAVANRFASERVRNLPRFQAERLKGLSGQVQADPLNNVRQLFDPSRGSKWNPRIDVASPYSGMQQAPVGQTALGRVAPAQPTSLYQGMPQAPTGNTALGRVGMSADDVARAARSNPGAAQLTTEQATARTAQQRLAARSGTVPNANPMPGGMGTVLNNTARTRLGAAAAGNQWGMGTIGNIRNAMPSMPSSIASRPWLARGARLGGGMIAGTAAAMGTDYLGNRIGDDNSIGRGLQNYSAGQSAGAGLGIGASLLGTGAGVTPVAAAVGAGTALGTAVGESEWYQNATGTQGNRLDNVDDNIARFARGSDQQGMLNQASTFINNGMSFSGLTQYLGDPQGADHLASWMVDAGIEGADADGNGGIILTGEADRAMTAFKQMSTGSDGGGGEIGQAMRNAVQMGWEPERIDGTFEMVMNAAMLTPEEREAYGISQFFNDEGIPTDLAGLIDVADQETRAVLAGQEQIAADNEAIAQAQVEAEERQTQRIAHFSQMAEQTLAPAVGQMEASADLAYEAQMANIGNLPPGMQQAAMTMAETTRSNQVSLANAYRAQISTTPSFLAMQAQMQAEADMAEQEAALYANSQINPNDILAAQIGALEGAYGQLGAQEYAASTGDQALIEQLGGMGTDPLGLSLGG